MNRLIYFFILMILPLSVFSQGNTDKVIQEINKSAASIKTMQCTFVQTKQMKMLNNKMVSHGKMYLSQPNKLRWEYTDPYKYIFILNNNQVSLQKNARTDVISVEQNKMFKEIARIMMNSVLGKCLSDTKSFKVSISSTATEHIATLIPQKKELKQFYNKIVLYYNRKASYVGKVVMYEKNGDTTTIELKNVKLNASINEALYSTK